MSLTKLEVFLITAVAVSSLLALAHEKTPPQSKNVSTSLKSVMKGLMEDNLKLNEGILTANFDEIKVAANKIANHPTPGVSTKIKLVSSLGSEMANFKILDTRVHNMAVSIEKAAILKDADKVMSDYHKLIDGCLACHSQYKERVSKILSNQ